MAAVEFEVSLSWSVIVAQRRLIADSNLPVLFCFFLCFFFFSANPLLINSSMQPDLTVSRTYTSPMCFQDSIDKELMAERSLLDPLPDLKVKGEEAEVFWKPVSEGVKPLLKRQIITEKSRVLLSMSDGQSILLWAGFLSSSNLWESCHLEKMVVENQLASQIDCWLSPPLLARFHSDFSTINWR